MKKQLNPAVKSMTTIALYLILLIGMWAVLGQLVFPGGQKSDAHQAFIDANAPLLEQLAQSAQNRNLYAELMATEKVNEVLNTGEISGILTDGDRVLFALTSAYPDARLWYLYVPGDAWPAPSGASWAEESVQADNVRRYVKMEDDSLFLSVRKLRERFYLVETNASDFAAGFVSPEAETD